MRTRYFCFFLLASLIGISCHKEQIIPHKAVSLSFDMTTTYQTIENFGASDAWSCQYVGAEWPDAIKNQMADLLFSSDTTSNGQPKGIGLSMWRFNLGGGSRQQGANSEIVDTFHREEAFIEPNGSYNWNRQAGQVWFLKAAQSRGVNQYMAFVNSPPVNFTNNGLAFSSDGLSNLASNNYQAFSDYLSSVTKEISNTTGITFKYISPVNEPQLPWDDKVQEGCPYNDDQISALSRVLSASLISHGLSTKILLPEAYRLNSLIDNQYYTGSENQISAFYQQSASTYVGNLKNIDQIVAAHDYYNTSPYTSGVVVRQQLLNKLNTFPGLRFWMTEYCIYGDNNGEINGGGRDLGMNPALYIARTIHSDLVNSNATAWQWWLAISPYNYKDGLLYIDPGTFNYYQSKMLWALGNFSRFIRPGDVRISLSSPQLNTNDNSLLVSAYKNINAQKIIFVVVNSKNAFIDLTIDNSTLSVKNTKLYITSNTNNLEPTTATGQISLPPYSISTLVEAY